MSYVSNREAARFMRRVEATSGILRVRVDGWMAWAVVRWEVHVGLMGLSLSVGRELTHRRLGYFLRHLHQLPGLFGRLVAMRESRTWVVQHASSLGSPTEDGRYSDRLWEEALRGCQVTRLMLVDNPLSEPLICRAVTPPDLRLEGIDLLIGLLSRLIQVAGLASYPAAQLRQDLLGAGFPEERLPNLSAQIARFRAQRMIWKWIMSIGKCRSLLITGWEGMSGAIAAAKELGVEVIELQHGLIDADHPGFSWIPEARSFRSTIPIPDRLLLFGPQVERQLRAGGFWTEELVVTGCSQIEGARSKRVVGRSSTVVVTLQPLSVGPLFAFLAVAIPLVPADVTWVLKMHPSQRQSPDSLRALLPAGDHITVLPGAALPSTLDLIAGALCHVSISSTCHLEALALGIPTVVLPLEGADHVQDLVDRGWALRVDSPASLACLVVGGLHTPPAQVAYELYADGGAQAIRDACGLAHSVQICV